MKLSLKQALLSLIAVPVVAFGIAASVAPTANAVDAADLSLSGGASSAKGSDQNDCLFGTSNENCTGTPIFKTITNVLLFVIGAISVIMLVVGGIRYTVSGGDSKAVTDAKNTILYAIVGIVVSLLAFAVVNFVIGSFKTTTP